MQCYGQCFFTVKYTVDIGCNDRDGIINKSIRIEQLKANKKPLGR